MTDNWWDILSMEPTKSTRDIKRAYAKKLKATRPEDDPAGFQELHDAYKMALFTAQLPEYVEPDALGEEIESINVTFIDGQLTESGQWADALPEFMPARPEISLSYYQNAAINDLMFRLDNLLAIPSGVQKLSRWQFLTECPDLLDDDFRIELGRRVIAAIISFNKRPQPIKLPSAPVSAKVITILDDVFFWSSTPYMFTDPATFTEVMEIVAMVDPGLRQVTARPVGGRIVEAEKNKKLKDPGTKDYKPSKQHSSDPISPWWIWAMIWIGYHILRSCN